MRQPCSTAGSDIAMHKPLPTPPLRRWRSRWAEPANEDGYKLSNDALRTLATRLLAYQAAALRHGRRSEAARLGQLLIDTAALKRALTAADPAAASPAAPGTDRG